MAINIGLPFNLGAQVAIDTRTVVANIAARDALSSGNRAYAGLTVYVINENKFYFYNGASWAELTSGGGNVGVGNLNFTYINSSANLLRNTKYGVDTSSSSFFVTLPTTNLNVGDVVEIIDLNKTFDIRNLTIQSPAHFIESSVGIPGLTCNIKGANFVLIYLGNPIGWRISVIDNNFSKAGILNNNPDLSVIPLLYLDINTNSELFDSNDSTNYKIPWNRVRWFDSKYTTISSTIDNTKYLTYNTINKNIYIREPGIYNVDLRFGSFNMIDSNDFLRARLRSSDTPIEGGLATNPPNPPSEGLSNSLNVLSAFAQGPIGVTQNGEAMCAGFTTLYLPEPIYITADFLHFGAFNTSNGLNRGFPVFNNIFGNRPFLFLSKLTSL